MSTREALSFHLLLPLRFTKFAEGADFKLSFPSTRRRLVKQKRLPKSKIEKLLDVFPQVMFASGRNSIHYVLYQITEMPRSGRIGAHNAQYYHLCIQHAGNGRRARELPGAALFCLSFTLKGLNMPGASEVRYLAPDKTTKFIYSGFPGILTFFSGGRHCKMY